MTVDDRHLDQLLARWGAAHRLDASEAEAILDAIVDQPALPPTWWADLHARVSDAVVLATAGTAGTLHGRWSRAA
jgi:hypothetical protein